MMGKIMATSSTSSPDQAPKKPTLVESVEDLIARKKSERGEEGAREVQKSAEGVQQEVADVMAGMEKPKEGISDKKEKKSEPGAGAGKKTTTPVAQVQVGDDDWTSAVFPDEEVMVKKVRTAIQLQIKVEWKKALRLQGKITEGGAQEYQSVIARIRGLKKMLSGLFSATFEYLKTVYMKYFRPDGQRRDLKDVSTDE